MSGPVQVIPQGLLGFFNLKNVGRNPRELIDSYQPTLECRDWLFQSEAIDNGPLPLVNVAGGASGGQRFPGALAIVTPPDEWWYVHEYTIRTSNPLLAGDTANIAPMLFTPIAGVINTYILSPASGALTGPNKHLGVSARGFWVPPGSELGFLILENASAGAIQYNGLVRFTRLPR